MNEKVEPFENDSQTSPGKRQRSTIAFPYTDFESSSKLADVIHEKVGRGQCTRGQLAAWVSQSFKSSSFRNQITAAKLFGVLETGDTPGMLRLTELGCRTVDPSKSSLAKADAFLNVPLFKELYEKYKDALTPPNAALEREMVTLGVAEKQKARARQVFLNSAQQAGFRDAAPTRLVMPAATVEQQKQQDNGGTGGDDGGGGDNELDPLIQAILNLIPKKKDWPAENRLRWFRTLAMNVSQVYDKDNNVVELKIELVSQPAKEFPGPTDKPVF